eukprot:7391903-Prymnesium_polylepis.2
MSPRSTCSPLVFIHLVELALHIRQPSGASLPGPRHGRFIAGPYVQPVAVARPSAHRAYDGGSGPCRKQRRCSAYEYAERVRPEVIGVLADACHQSLDGVTHEVRVQRPPGFHVPK